MIEIPKSLIIIGNGFDLAHGLKTKYLDFICWYFNQVLNVYKNKSLYEDELIELPRREVDEVNFTYSNLNEIKAIFDYLKFKGVTINYKSPFFKKLIDYQIRKGWVDIEAYYYRFLLSYFKNPSYNQESKIEHVTKLNNSFEFLTTKLIEYLKEVNSSTNTKLDLKRRDHNLYNVFFEDTKSEKLFLCFNYTDTLLNCNYANENECLFIHGRVSDINRNPIIFGYGDETSSDYQGIEDSGENTFLRHMKSFCYFLTGNYQRLLQFIDRGKYNAYVLGHSCGLSDRVLLSTIFEHNNCASIEIFYHEKNDGSNNFRELTQEISRHFKSNNKWLMRSRVMPMNRKNIIPQNQ